jgi:hypothetical protein
MDEAEKEVDLANTHNSKLLSEANGHLRTKSGFRGFHPEELRQFREYQAVQREEAKAKAKAAVDEERAFARYASVHSQCAARNLCGLGLHVRSLIYRRAASSRVEAQHV